MKKFNVETCMVALSLLLGSCISGNDTFSDSGSSGYSSNSSSGSSSTGTSVSGDLASFTVAIDSTTAISETETVDADNEDFVESGTFESTVTVIYNGTSATVDKGSLSGVTVTTSGADVTVNSEVGGVNYVLKGSTSDGSFKINSTKKFKLTLDGVNITNSDGPAINSQSGKRAYVVLADGTSNYLKDGTSYASSTEDQKGTIFAEGKLIFSGGGRLCVYANTKAGISADDYVTIHKDVNIYVKATAGNGIKANDAINICGGIVNIETSATAAKAISSDSLVNISGGRTVVITTGGGEYDSDENDASACAGVKADYAFNMTGGELQCKSSGAGGKGISCDGELTISDGAVRVITEGKTYTSGSSDSKAKGIKADGNVNISGGDVMVRAIGGDGCEGIESKSILTISGGSTQVEAYDDAINSSSHMYIKGDGTYVVAIGLYNDGLDSNGNMYIQGGTIEAYGTTSPECGIDANEESNYHVFFTGGTLLAVGGGNSVPSSSSSTQAYISTTGSVTSGSTMELFNGSTSLAQFTPCRSYNNASILITCAGLSSGSSYTLSNNGSSSSVTASQYGSSSSSMGGGGMTPGGHW